MKLLHIDSSILAANSVSRTLSGLAVNRIKALNENVEVTYRDLAAEPIAHLSGAYLAAVQGFTADHASDLQQDLAVSASALQEFIEADTIVIGVAFYNFTIPSQLKAWVDRILVAGQTFRYGTDGRPEGLAGAKRVLLTIARGGFYGPGMPTEAAEHAEAYLRTVFGFIGVHNFEVIAAEGIAIGPEQREAAILTAESQIAKLAA